VGTYNINYQEISRESHKLQYILKRAPFNR